MYLQRNPEESEESVSISCFKKEHRKTTATANYDGEDYKYLKKKLLF